MKPELNNFTVLESVHGKFIVNRHCSFQADALIKTGRTHIEDELAKLMAIARVLPENCVVLDAGANVGLVSIPLANEIKARGGIVHAFEIQRMLFHALCGSVALNDLDNLYVHHQGLGATAGWASLTTPDYGTPQDFGTCSLLDSATGNIHEQIQVATIDSLALRRLDLLKIDVEGMEPAVLLGAKDSIQRFSPWCWIEYWKTGIDVIKAAFADENYRFFPMDQLNLLCVPATKLAASGITINGYEA